jgi:hypothetical protein
VPFIFDRLSKNPELLLVVVFNDGKDASLDCNIEFDKLFELSIIIKINILIFIINSHVLFKG